MVVWLEDPCLGGSRRVVVVGKASFPSLSSQLGAKKGLGAQKVSSQSFSEIERQAQVAEKLREQQAADAKKQAEESM